MLKNFEYKKSLGQNFINDDNIIKKMVNGAEIDKDTLVIEIGPGAGVLSNEIIPKCKNAILYEIDTRLEDILIAKLMGYDNYKIIFNDFLKEDVKNEVACYDYEKLYVVANLPYYITTPIIEKLIQDISPDKIIIMIQKEVADRFCAKVGSKEYGYITVYLNYFYDIKKMFDVSRNCFTPKPNVDSTIISMNKKNRDIEVKDIDFFNKLLKDSFKFKRKTLRNNLKGYNLEIIESVLIRYGFDLTTRAENISTDIFIEIANELLK